jgi:hypothetical protein
MCDGVSHCSDGYDEQDCTSKISTSGDSLLFLFINIRILLLIVVSPMLTVNDSCSISSNIFTCSTSSTPTHPICISRDRICDG